MLYNGNLDIICGLPLDEATLRQLEWDGQDEYKAAPRLVWKVSENDTDVAGYVRHARSLYQVAVRSAGHMTPVDQPRATYDLINRLVFHKGF